MCSLIEEFNNVLQSYKANFAVLYWNDSSNSCASITYDEVEEFSKCIVDVILSNIKEKNICLGLFMEHNYLIPSIVISCHRCSISFIFLDPYENPENNLNIIKTLKLKWIISNSENDDFLSKHGRAKASSDITPLKLWEIDFVTEINDSFNKTCYVICTSGTTGNPKIVKVEHNCIMLNIISLRKKFGLTQEDILYFGTPLTFDPSMVELFLAITTGACLLIAPNKFKLNPTRLLNILFPSSPAIYKGVTFLQMVPSLFLRWNPTDIEFILQKTCCRILAFGGEKFPEGILKLPKCQQLQIFNLYGITEVSCWASVYEVINPNEDIKLGELLADTIFEVRNEDGIRIVCGEGELYIGSSSRICHIDQENSSNLLKQVFRSTGDIVQLKDSKDIFYVGRKDNIIKRFGHRVNMLEIQEMIFKHTNIPNICIYRENDHKLLLFLKILEYNTIVKQKIMDKVRVKLLHILPKHYFPDYIKIISHIPLTQHGKIDRKSLEEMYTNQISDSSKKVTNCKDVFVQLLSKYLGLSFMQIEKYLNCNFLDAGGNSISAIQLLSEFQDIVNIKNNEHLTTLLFEKSLKECSDYVNDIKIINLKRKQYNVDYELVHDDKIQILEKCEHQQESDIKLEICWKVDLLACVDCSPTIIENRDATMVAVGSFAHIFAVINTTNGNIISQIVLPDTVESAGLVSQSNPYIYIGSHDGNMYCLNYITGSTVWKYATNDIIKCTPCFCLEYQAIAFGSYDKYIHCINAENGSILWKTLVNESVTSNPVFIKQKIYVATTFGTCFCLNENNGEILWKHRVGAPIFGSPCIYNSIGGNAIVWPGVNGMLHCFSCETGKKEWIFNSHDKIFSSLLWYENNIVFGCHDHRIYCIQADQMGCTVKYRTLLDSVINAKPNVILQNGYIYIIAASNNGNVYIIDYNDGKIIVNLQLPGQIFSAPVVKDNQIFIGCRDNNLYCINIVDNKKLDTL